MARGGERRGNHSYGFKKSGGRVRQKQPLLTRILRARPAGVATPPAGAGGPIEGRAREATPAEAAWAAAGTRGVLGLLELLCAPGTLKSETACAHNTHRWRQYSVPPALQTEIPFPDRRHTKGARRGGNPGAGSTLKEGGKPGFHFSCLSVWLN